MTTIKWKAEPPFGAILLGVVFIVYVILCVVLVLVGEEL